MHTSDFVHCNQALLPALLLLVCISASLLLQDIDRESLLLQCICSCPVAYANVPSSAPTMAPMMDPTVMADDMADAMDSDADANSSGPSSGSGCAPEPVPTQYEAFENVGPFSIFTNPHADIHALVHHAVTDVDCYTIATVICCVLHNVLNCMFNHKPMLCD